MRIFRFLKSKTTQWAILLLALTPLLMAGDCDSDDFGDFGDFDGGVYDIVAGVFQMVMGILELVD